MNCRSCLPVWNLLVAASTCDADAAPPLRVQLYILPMEENRNPSKRRAGFGQGLVRQVPSMWM